MLCPWFWILMLLILPCECINLASPNMALYAHMRFFSYSWRWVFLSFTSVRDWGRAICTNTSIRKNLPTGSLGSGIWRALCCHCSVFYEIRRRYHCLFKQGFGPLCKVNGIWGATKPRAFLSRTQETRRSCWGITIRSHKLIKKEQSQLCLSPSLLTLQVNQGLYILVPDEDIRKGLQ